MRKCIRPLSEITLRGLDDDPRVPVLISRTVSIDLMWEQVLRHAVCPHYRDRSRPKANYLFAGSKVRPI